MIAVNNIKQDYDKNCIAENTEYQAKIALPYVSDYMYAASPEVWTKPGYTQSGLTDKDGNYGIIIPELS